jgi:hypothetical protein
MFLGTILFILFFIMLAPQSRAFLGGHLATASQFILHWAPFSYLFLLLLVAALAAAIYLVRTWPARQDPENPMSKYNREDPFEE